MRIIYFSWVWDKASMLESTEARHETCIFLERVPSNSLSGTEIPETGKLCWKSAIWHLLEIFPIQWPGVFLMGSYLRSSLLQVSSKQYCERRFWLLHIADHNELMLLAMTGHTMLQKLDFEEVARGSGRLTLRSTALQGSHWKNSLGPGRKSFSLAAYLGLLPHAKLNIMLAGEGKNIWCP